MLVKVAGPMIKIGVSLPKNVLAPLATMTFASPIDSAIERKTHGWRIARAWKGITLMKIWMILLET